MKMQDVSQGNFYSSKAPDIQLGEFLKPAFFLLCWRVDQGGLCYHASHLLPYKSQQRESARGDQARQDNKRNLSKLVCVLNISRWTYYSSQVIYVLLLYKQLLPYTPPQLPICHMGTHAAYKGDFSNVFQMLFLLFFFFNTPTFSDLFNNILQQHMYFFNHSTNSSSVPKRFQGTILGIRDTTRQGGECSLTQRP